MSLINNIDELKAIIPTITGRNIDSLDNYASALQGAEYWLRTSILGQLFSVIQQDPTLKRHCSAIVAFAAYAESIPMLDLVNTSTGFGVVNDNNLAPASRDRVKALIESVTASRRSAEANLYEYLEDNESLLSGWAMAPGSTVIKSLISTKRAFSNYGDFVGGYDEWRRAKPKHRIVISNYIAPLLSSELTAELIIEGDNQGEYNAKIIDDVRLSFASYFNDDKVTGDSLIMSVVRYVRNHLDQYLAYKNSTQNQAITRAASTVGVGIFC